MFYLRKCVKASAIITINNYLHSFGKYFFIVLTVYESNKEDTGEDKSKDDQVNVWCTQVKCSKGEVCMATNL